MHDETSVVFYFESPCDGFIFVTFFTGVVEGLIDDTVEEEREEEEEEEDEESEGEQGVRDEESGDEIKKKRKRSKCFVASEPS